MRDLGSFKPASIANRKSETRVADTHETLKPRAGTGFAARWRQLNGALLNRRSLGSHRPAPHGWAGEYGRINGKLLGRRLHKPHAKHEYFIYGLNPTPTAVESSWGDLGVPMSTYHSERCSFA